MDNLTHSVVGLAAAKAGLERLSPGATVVSVLAANAPDSDVLATLGGRWFYLQHHRGITHSLVGTLALALFIPVLFYLGDWLIARLRGRARRVRFWGLLLVSVVMCFSHPLLDWTNNYGVRPFLPWSAEWYYGDLVFIVDPWIWLVVGGAAFLLTARTRWRTLPWAALALLLSLLVLSSRLERVGFEYPNALRVIWFTALVALALAHWKQLGKRWGSKLALGALCFVVVYWGALSFLHRGALTQAQTMANNLAAQRNERVVRLAAMPTLANPLRWRCLWESESATYAFNLTLGREDALNLESNAKRYEKPNGAEAALTERAARDERAVVLLNFARFPVARVEGDCLSRAIVEFADLRYTEPEGRGNSFASASIPVACPPEVGAADSR